MNGSIVELAALVVDQDCDNFSKQMVVFLPKLQAQLDTYKDDFEHFLFQRDTQHVQVCAAREECFILFSNFFQCELQRNMTSCDSCSCDEYLIFIMIDMALLDMVFHLYYPCIDFTLGIFCFRLSSAGNKVTVLSGWYCDSIVRVSLVF